MCRGGSELGYASWERLLVTLSQTTAEVPSTGFSSPEIRRGIRPYPGADLAGRFVTQLAFVIRGLAAGAVTPALECRRSSPCTPTQDPQLRGNTERLMGARAGPVYRIAAG